MILIILILEFGKLVIINIIEYYSWRNCIMQTELLENPTLIENDTIVDEQREESASNIKSIISKYKEQMVVTVKSDKKIKLV